MSDSDAARTELKKVDAGWDVGVRETVHTTIPMAWDFLLGEGLPLWLGETTLSHEKGAAYRTADGVAGEVRAFHPDSRIRVTWKPDDWPHDTTLQLTVRDGEGGTTIAISHEKLADREERRMMLGHWKNVMAHIASAF